MDVLQERIERWPEKGRHFAEADSRGSTGEKVCPHNYLWAIAVYIGVRLRVRRAAEDRSCKCKVRKSSPPTDRCCEGPPYPIPSNLPWS